jgi:hypothetical protein
MPHSHHERVTFRQLLGFLLVVVEPTRKIVALQYSLPPNSVVTNQLYSSYFGIFFSGSPRKKTEHFTIFDVTWGGVCGTD